MLRRLYWFATQFGFDPLAFARALTNIPRYIRGFFRFRARFAGPIGLTPCLHDLREEGGAAKNEYFWQDLVVARKIHAANPERHVDVGSRVDGFIAHVASFREIEIIDIRPITAQIPGVRFRQADVMVSDPLLSDYCDSLSCLHALEHFGLGRYGDNIDPHGPERGIANMSAMVKTGGTLYLSTPVGRERVEFNANWVFDPRRLVDIAQTSGLRLVALETFERGVLSDEGIDDDSLTALSAGQYKLGIFTFVKA